MWACVTFSMLATISWKRRCVPSARELEDRLPLGARADRRDLLPARQVGAEVAWLGLEVF
jgi:hypothetical protein